MSVKCKSDGGSGGGGGDGGDGCSRYDSDIFDMHDERPSCANFAETVIKEEPKTETETDFTFNESPSWNDHFDEHNDFPSENETTQSHHEELSSSIVKTEHIDDQLADEMQCWKTSNEDARSTNCIEKSKCRKSTPKRNRNQKQRQSQVQNEDPRRFICDICSKGFRLKHHIVIHLRTHTGQRDFKCELCSKTFAQSSHLSLHLKALHYGDLAFPCPCCEKRFIHRGDLHRHCKTHRNELPFSCRNCGRRFDDEHAKKSHESDCKSQLHKCELCAYETPVSSRFKTHMRKHTNERPFQCDICPKNFLYKQNLENHVKTHSNEVSQMSINSSKVETN